MVANPARVLFRDPSYDGQLVRTLAAAVVASADLGEALATARRIRRCTGVSWYDAWSGTADQARTGAEKALASGEQVRARGASFGPASTTGRLTILCARMSAITGSSPPIEAMSIRSGPPPPLWIVPSSPSASRMKTPPCRASCSRRTPRANREPTVIFPCGYDSTAEAGWVDVPAALDRGYNVLVFEGPGQGEALYVQHRYFRPDFEHVLTPVLSWLLDRSDVDPAAVVLVGRSFAGYLAPRAATSEHRLAALVCDPAQPDMAVRLPSGPAAKVAAPVARAQMRVSANRAEFFGARMAAHGIDDVDRYFAELRLFTMLDRADRYCLPHPHRRSRRTTSPEAGAKPSGTPSPAPATWSGSPPTKAPTVIAPV